MSDVSELIARLEGAVGPDRELDAEIWLAVTPGATRKATFVNHHTRPYTIDETREAGGRLITVPSYTTSLDAAMTLLDGVGTLQSVHYEIKPYMDCKQWRVSVRSGGHRHARGRTFVGTLAAVALECRTATGQPAVSKTPDVVSGDEALGASAPPTCPPPLPGEQQ